MAAALCQGMLGHPRSRIIFGNARFESRHGLNMAYALIVFLISCRHMYMYVRLKVKLDVHGFMYSLFLYTFALHVSGAICTHPQEHKLQSTALGV
jgi:hypothetical protein